MDEIYEFACKALVKEGNEYGYSYRGISLPLDVMDWRVNELMLDLLGCLDSELI